MMCILELPMLEFDIPLVGRAIEYIPRLIPFEQKLEG